MLSPGTIIAERYEIISSIGDGGMGSVYKGRQIGLDRIIALKTLHPHLLADANSRDRFEREGKILSLLTHEHLMVFYEFGFFDEVSPFMAMEFVDGMNLRKILSVGGKLEWKRCLKIAEQVAEALAYSHRHHIVHRDLSPSNIMLVSSSDDFVKVIDFGLARLFGDGKGALQTLTETGLLVGNPLYMSPEQCLGKKVDSRSDIYSFSCILYECLAGETPFSADNPIGVIHKHINEEVIPLSIKAKIPIELSSVIEKGLQKNPEHRYQSMEEYLSDLRYLLKDEYESVLAASEFSRSTGVSRKTKTVLLWYSILILGLLSTLAFLYSEPGIATPIALFMRQNKTEKVYQEAEKFADWLEEVKRYKSAELIYSTISNLYNPSLPDGKAAIRWFKLSRVQFALHQSNLASKSLVLGFRSIDNMPAEKLAPYAPYIDELIPKMLHSGLVIPGEAKGCLHRLAAGYSDLKDVETTKRLWDLIVYKIGTGSLYAMSLELLDNIGILNDSGRTEESAIVSSVLLDYFDPKAFKSKLKEFSIATNLCKLCVDISDLKRAAQFLKLAEDLMDSGLDMSILDRQVYYSTKGMYLYKSGDHAQGLIHLRKGLELAKNIGDGGTVALISAQCLSHIYWQEGKRDQGIAVLSAALSSYNRPPHNLSAFNSSSIDLANMLLDRNKIAQAKVLIKEVGSELTMDSRNELLAYSLLLSVKEGNWAAFLSNLKSAVSSLPKDYCVAYLQDPLLQAFLKGEKIPWVDIRQIANEHQGLSPVFVAATASVAQIRGERGKIDRCFVLLDEAKKKIESVSSGMKEPCILALRVRLPGIANVLYKNNHVDALKQLVAYCQSFPANELVKESAYVEDLLKQKAKV